MFLDADLMRRSLNYRLIEEGLAYPTYYEGLFQNLRDALTEEVARARAKTLGVWAEDRTTAGFEVEGLQSVTEEHVILPKLFKLGQQWRTAGLQRGLTERLTLQPPP